MADKFYEEIFQKNGASYHRAMQQYPSARDQEFEAALSLLDIQSGDTVLDVPAGGGYLETYLPKGTNYLGYDFSGAFGHGASGISKCSETKIDLPDQSVDYLICLAALHHVEDRIGFYREAKRVLKPQGTMLIGDVVAKTPPASFLNDFVNQWNELGHQGDFIQEGREDKELKQFGYITTLAEKGFYWKLDSRANTRSFVRLLFCLDKNPHDRNLDNALADLGITNTSSGTLLPWSLGFILAKLA